MNDKQSKRQAELRRSPLTDRELDRLWAEVQAADEADAGEEADLPEGVPAARSPDSVVAIFFRRKDGGR